MGSWLFGFMLMGFGAVVWGLLGFLGLGLFIGTTKDNPGDIEIVPAALRL